MGFLFFAWIPPLSSAAVRRRRPPPRRTHYSLTHSLTHPPTHPLTHSITHSLTHAGAVHRASWRSCGAVAVAGPRLPFAWQAQYTEPPHFPFAWQAKYTELPGGAAARWPPLARGCLLPGRRSTQSLRTSLLRGRRSTQSFLAELWRGGRRWPAAAFCLAASRTQTQSLAWQAQYTVLHCSSQILTAPLLTRPLLITTHHITTYHIPTHHSSTSHTSLLTAPLSHHNFSSQLITTYPITAPLLTPLLTPHLSHQNSSQLHFSHLTSQVHFSHLTPHTSPKFTLKSYIHKGLTCGVILSFYFRDMLGLCWAIIG